MASKRCVRVCQGGDILQVIDLDRGCFACVLGGPERRTLYMAANEWNGAESVGNAPRMGQVLSTEVAVPGVGWS